ncbi:MAG: hypothetical protein RID91_20490 [Azospirillaceae bacterium]
MDDVWHENGPLLRLFQVKMKNGYGDILLEKFATTSADVVRDEPGNEGYFFGKIISGDDGRLIFASLWKDLDAVKRRFGEDWQESYLPEGYEDLIEECSVRHFDLSNGWFVRSGR